MSPRALSGTDLRHLELHRRALEKLREHDELRGPCLDLLDRWLADPAQAHAGRWLHEWKEMLRSWPIDRLAEIVLDEERGQALRKCSPLGPTLTPQERWKIFTSLHVADGEGPAAGE